MSREVFQANKLLLFAIVIAVYVGATIVYFQTDIPVWILPIVLVIGLVVIFMSIKTKVTVEEGMLRYEKLGGGDEIDLKKVSQIVIREVETIVNRSTEHSNQGSSVRAGSVSFGNNQQNVNQERKVERFIYVLDEPGRTLLSFPANIVGFTQRTRFKEAIQATNPDIEVF